MSFTRREDARPGIRRDPHPALLPSCCRSALHCCSTLRVPSQHPATPQPRRRPRTRLSTLFRPLLPSAQALCAHPTSRYQSLQTSRSAPSAITWCAASPAAAPAATPSANPAATPARPPSSTPSLAHTLTTALFPSPNRSLGLALTLSPNPMLSPTQPRPKPNPDNPKPNPSPIPRPHPRRGTARSLVPTCDP